MNSENQTNQPNQTDSESSQTEQYPTPQSREQITSHEDKKKNIFRRIFKKFFPPLAPRYPVEERLIKNEKVNEKSYVLHLSNVQLLLGIVIFVIGIILFNSYFFIGLIVISLGMLLLLIAYEIEEIIITNKRILIRKIGMMERILRIPSDEEHLLKHVVSFYVGRAPVNKPVLVVGFVLLIANGFVLPQIDPNPVLIYTILISCLIIFYIGLRLRRRALRIYLSGGHFILIGVRKGVPQNILKSFTQMVISETSD
jgi:hypothetical protein